MLGKIDWVWFAAGILFTMFVIPIITRLLGTLKANSGTKKVA